MTNLASWPYAQDTKRFAVFDDLYRRVDTLKRSSIRLSYKHFDVGAEGFNVYTNHSKLRLEMLSSGEQHACFLLYDRSLIKSDSLMNRSTFLRTLGLHVASTTHITRPYRNRRIVRFSNVTSYPFVLSLASFLVVELTGSASATKNRHPVDDCQRGSPPPSNERLKLDFDR